MSFGTEIRYELLEGSLITDYIDYIKCSVIVKICDNFCVLQLYRNMEKREVNHEEIATADVMSMALKPQRILNAIRYIKPLNSNVIHTCALSGIVQDIKPQN